MIIIRPATLNDLDQMFALDQEIFGAYGADESTEVIQARIEIFPEGCAILEKQEVDGSATFLGYLTTEKWIHEREPTLDIPPQITHHPEGHILCITTLVVAPEHQNLGLGQRLLNHAIKIAKQQDCNQIILETAQARAFYLKHGFEIIGQRTQWDIRLDIMRLNLNS